MKPKKDETYEYGVWEWGPYWSMEYRNRTADEFFSRLTDGKFSGLQDFYDSIVEKERKRMSNTRYKFVPYWIKRGFCELGD